MNIGTHLRRTFLSGTFAAVPVVITVVAVYYVNHYTTLLAPQIRGHDIPFLGLIIAIVAIYLLGLTVSTTLARMALHRLDVLLEHLPVLHHAYRAWKQVSLTHGSGMWEKVVLVRVDAAAAAVVGFTSGDPVDGAPTLLCVYVPNAPVPTTGRLYLIPASRCQVLSTSADEAFKHILSSGNYIPPSFGPAAETLLQPVA
jgi:uncharacterized membrane protein